MSFAGRGGGARRRDQRFDVIRLLWRSTGGYAVRRAIVGVLAANQSAGRKAVGDGKDIIASCLKVLGC